MRHTQWNQECEPVRRQRGGHGGPRERGGPWGGPGGGPPSWVAQMFGPEFGGRPGGRGGRARVRRGDVRSAILDVLAGAEEPINGYQVIQQIAERTEGAWKPSPGSVYPTIAQLQDEELVEDAPNGRKAIQLTAEGKSYAAAHTEEMAAVWAPFEHAATDHEAVNLKEVIGQTVGAVVQVMKAGTPEQRDRAVEILDETRRRLYGLLAEGPDDSEETDEGTAAEAQG